MAVDGSVLSPSEFKAAPQTILWQPYYP